MAQAPRGSLYGTPSKGHHGVCAIYCENTVYIGNLVLGSYSPCVAILKAAMKRDPGVPDRRRSQDTSSQTRVPLVANTQLSHKII